MVTTRIHALPLRGHGDDVRRERPLFGLRGRQQWEQANRRGLLMVHGLVGTFAGLLILFNGTAATFEGHDWLRPVTGALAFAGGALLLAGLGAHRQMRLEVVGLVLLAAWDLSMTAGFVVTALEATEVPITWPWQVVTNVSSVRLYPIALYVGLFVMMCVHLVTLHQIRRVEARSLLRPPARS